ncbi:MAG: enoyl-CoA hydratase-related protein, partial [Bacteroidota bacterium]
MAEEAVLLSIDDAVATIRLNRPEAFNSVNAALAEGLIQALDQCAEDEAVRCIVLTGSGKSFCAGQDLKEVTNPDKSQVPEFRDLLEQRYDPIVKRLRRIEKPIV